MHIFVIQTQNKNEIYVTLQVNHMNFKYLITEPGLYACHQKIQLQIIIICKPYLIF